MRAFGWRVAAMAALMLIGLPLSGCEWRGLTILIPDFDSKQVEGIWLWRLSEQTGQFERDGEVTLSEPFLRDGVEQIEYVQENPYGSGPWRIPVVVLRDPRNPDAVTLSIKYCRRSAPGEFRATTYNAAGESQLSAESSWL